MDLVVGMGEMPIKGMTVKPYGAGDPNMEGAFVAFVEYAMNDDQSWKAFCLHNHNQEGMADDAVLAKFADWVAVNHWGNFQDQVDAATQA
jgi:hypothetical protein